RECQVTRVKSFAGWAQESIILVTSGIQSSFRILNKVTKMKVLRLRFNRTAILRPTVAYLLLVALITGSLAAGFSEDKKKAPGAGLSEEQKILHVLNRLGFGARPGDVQRVKTIGIEAYINQQLHPEDISDAASEAKLRDRNLTTLSMSTAELYEKFPQPGQLLKQLERKGDLPKDLAEARDNRVKGAANAVAKGGDAKNGGEEMAGEAMSQSEADKKGAANPVAAPANQDIQKYREALRDYYQKNGLESPQRIS